MRQPSRRTIMITLNPFELRCCKQLGERNALKIGVFHRSVKQVFQDRCGKVKADV